MGSPGGVSGKEPTTIFFDNRRQQGFERHAISHQKNNNSDNLFFHRKGAHCRKGLSTASSTTSIWGMWGYLGQFQRGWAQAAPLEPLGGLSPCLRPWLQIA